MSWLPKSGYFISRNRSLLHSIGGHCPLMQEGVRLTMNNNLIYKSVSYHWDASFSLSTGVVEDPWLILLLLSRFKLSIIFTGSPSYPEMQIVDCEHRGTLSTS